ncbi:MAG: nicotinate-nucleotide--dimethylbenzimidazole phosphoribosyltransferase, partial [Syntrophomonas sp.]
DMFYNRIKELKMEIRKYGLVIFAGDNGISRENISIYEPMNSAAIVNSHIENKSPTAFLLNRLDKKGFIVDVGLAQEVKHEKVMNRNVAKGSQSFLSGNALSHLQAVAGIEAGRSLWNDICAEDFDIIGVGEIGIGSTLCAAALAAVITGKEAALLVGRGSSPANIITKKADIISRAFKLRYPKPNDTVDLLARFGGLEIAALTGFISRAPEYHKAIMLDGFVTSVAALLAKQIDPKVPAFIIAPSLSEETGHLPVLDHLGLNAVFDLDMNYGEGLAALIGLFLAEISWGFHRLD